MISNFHIMYSFRERTLLSLHFLLVILALLVLPIQTLAVSLPPDRTVWEEVDIVPMPKRIRLTGRHLLLQKGVIVIGKNHSEQDRIGANWINDHIIQKGGKALPVITDDRLPDDAALKIYVGTRNTNAVIDDAVRQKLFELGPDIPGAQGYVIQPRNNGVAIDILMGGADPIGALYACVTLAGLLEKDGNTVVLREAKIVDWPDYQLITHGWNLENPELQNLGNRVRWAGEKCPEELREKYLRMMKKYLDQLLGWKISCFKVSDVRYWRNLSQKFMATYHEITDYAKARGIHSLYYAFKPFAGLRKELPDTPERCLTSTGRKQYKKYVRCWSMDERRRENARRIGSFAKAVGITDIGFHDTDTGGYLNPARWNDRCEICRRRWGNDYTAATLNKHRIFYEEIKKVYPDCRIHFTLYPYNISILTQKTAEQHYADRYGPSPSVPEVARQLREQFTDFWIRQAKGLPADVTFVIRENVPINVERFQKLTDQHGTFIWYLVGSKQWRTFFDRSPSWAPNFYSGRGDLMFTVSMESFIPLKALAVREYCWNVKTPGVEAWNKLPDDEWWKNAEAKGKIYTTVLPHIVRNLFGRRAAPELTKVFSLNMAMNHIFNYEPTGKRLTPVLKTYDKWNWQAEQAEKGCDILDKLFERFVKSGDNLGMTDYAARRFIYIREVFHCSKWMARAKAENIHARELAKERKLEEARAAVQHGFETVVKGHEDMKRLLAERPEDPIYNVKTKPNKSPPSWQVYTPGNHVNFDYVEKLLETTKKELTSIVAARDLPLKALKSLSRRSKVHVARASSRPTIDGRLDEADWRDAMPAEAFLIYPGGQSMAQAHTRSRFLRDDSTLFLGVTCWMPEGASIQTKARENDGAIIEDEHLELFLKSPHMKEGFVQFLINAKGNVAVRFITVTRNNNGKDVKHKDLKWEAAGIIVRTSRGRGRWELEAAIPLSAFGEPEWQNNWRVNIVRYLKTSDQGFERSTIMRPSGQDLYDTNAFLQLSFDPIPAPKVDVEMAIKGVKNQAITLDDHVATIVDFGVEVRTSRILHNVSVTAEAYDEAGRLHAKKVIQNLNHLSYYWSPTDRFAIGFEHVVNTCGVRLLLEYDEGKYERWIRVNGWQGTKKIGSIYSSGEKKSQANGFRQSHGLREICYFPTQIEIDRSKRPLKLFNRREGTIEFWFKPEWIPRHRLDNRPTKSSRYVLLHFGVLRKEYPEHFNGSALTIFYDSKSDAIYFPIRNRRYAGWTVHSKSTERISWKSPTWHHLASVWDHDAKKEGWLRIYLDGKLVSSKTLMHKEERLQIKKAVELDEQPYAIQIGSLNTGRYTAEVVIDEFRLSRNARYNEDFIPTTKPLVLDRKTSALFHFNSSLSGRGMTEAGEDYLVHGVAGALEHH